MEALLPYLNEIGKNLNLNLKDSYSIGRETSLMSAVRFGNNNLVQIMIDDGCSPFHYNGIG